DLSGRIPHREGLEELFLDALPAHLEGVEPGWHAREAESAIPRRRGLENGLQVRGVPEENIRRHGRFALLEDHASLERHAPSKRENHIVLPRKDPIQAERHVLEERGLQAIRAWSKAFHGEAAAAGRPYAARP